MVLNVRNSKFDNDVITENVGIGLGLIEETDKRN